MSQGATAPQASDVVEFDGRRGWSRRTWTVVLVALGLLLGTGWLVQDRVRSADEEALAACSERADTALRAKDERFEFMADYLRPALIALPADGRDNLYALMSRTATENKPRVRDALEVCEAVEPAWFHPGLRARRDALVDHLRGTVALLESIEADGGRYYADTPQLDAERLRLFPDHG